MPNRLSRETCPYLLQHAENPVDWYPWGEEALASARADDKPILVVAHSDPGDEAARHIPLLNGRPMHGGCATAYVCQGSTCQTPVSSRRDLMDQIDAASVSKQGEIPHAR
jgi:uncharacterized protein YyaL (SSP411 family)